jgi:hypothetical protein
MNAPTTTPNVSPAISQALATVHAAHAEQVIEQAAVAAAQGRLDTANAKVAQALSALSAAAQA